MIDARDRTTIRKEAACTSLRCTTMRPRSRRWVPWVIALEDRCLLSGGPVASWLGQDGHDLAGGASPLSGNGVQDIHILISGLPSNHAVASMDVQGYGGGDWRVNLGPYSPFNGAFEQSAGATTGDLYLDPYQTETGRQFYITINYDDQTSTQIVLNGGTADPNLRMPADSAVAAWYGQDGPDLTGTTTGVGPDGYRDVHLALSQLYGPTGITGVRVTASSGTSWESGTNPGARLNAEFLRNSSDPTRGDLYFSPNQDLNGQTLTIQVTYADGKLDTTTLQAGSTNPTLAESAPAAVSLTWNTIHATWIGQDGLNLVGPGDAHITLDSIPAGRTVVTAVLSDQSGIDWSYVKPGSGATAADPAARPLGFLLQSDPTRADLSFPPARNENGATLTLVLGLDDGTYLAARLVAGTTDPGLRAPDISASVVIAYPGDDLNDLANRYGTVRLVSGIYPVTQPLVLNHPVSILGAPGSTLVFGQSAADAPWTAAIKVQASHTTLDGFAVRFAGPVRWNTSVSYGPAVIGTTDNLDPWSGDPRLDLSFTHLDLQSPPASSSWEEAIHLIRLASAESGVIANNRLKGGTIELFNGPWQITSNTYLGTLPNTYANSVVSTHYTHDVTIANNVIQPTSPTGKTWRFLVMTQAGNGDVVSGNRVTGVGPMDSDTVANPNAPEIILTESYRIHYEGVVASVSADGRIVQIFSPQGDPARTGDVLALLSGAQAGQWRMIAQVINPTTYLLDSPITPGVFNVSIATGFVNESYNSNTIDARGSSVADDLVLAGNQFGAQVLNNTFLGGNHAFRISAYPSEAPNMWGWTHAPFLGATIAGNTIQDTQLGGMIDVEHSSYTKANTGRVYFSGSFHDNLGVWTSGFLATRATIAGLPLPALVTVGDALSNDTGELVLSASANSIQAPASLIGTATFQVIAGTLNGLPVNNSGIVLPGVATPSATRATVSAPVTVTSNSTPLTIARAPVSAPVVTRKTVPTVVVQPPLTARQVWMIRAQALIEARRRAWLAVREDWLAKLSARRIHLAQAFQAAANRRIRAFEHSRFNAR